jgi:hypothetical protein
LLAVILIGSSFFFSMTPDFRALCLELLQFGDQAGEIAANEGLWPDCDPGPDWLLDRARAALAQPEPEEPTDDKLMDIARKTNLVYYMGEGYGFASPYEEEIDITAEVLAFARKVRALDNGSASNPAEA